MASNDEMQWSYPGELVTHEEWERRHAKAINDLMRRYAVKFAVDSDDEPTDENIKRVLAGCARSPQAGEYAAIRRYVGICRRGELDA
jgi:hypothetical protein